MIDRGIQNMLLLSSFSLVIEMKKKDKTIR